MNKKSFFISISFHLFLGIIVISLIFLVKEPQKEIYIPVYLKNFHSHTERFTVSPKTDNNIKKIYYFHKIKHVHKKISHKIFTQKISSKKTIIKTTSTSMHATLKKLPKIDKKHQAINAKDIKQQQMVERQYFNYIYTLISRYKTYPLMARRLEQTGTVKLKFIILKNGYISNISVDTSSGFIALDKAARNILIKINHFRPIPILLAKSTLKIIIPISYQLN